MPSVTFLVRRVIPFLVCALSASAASVRVESVPEDGVQPQIVVDDAETAHLVYLKGEPQSCDVRYVRKVKAARQWTLPNAVNSEPKSAIAMGTIRGAQAALGQGGTLHVVWNGSSGALFYSRLEPGEGKFAPQRNLLAGTVALDGGASVAANARGEVFVFWHGKLQVDGPDETARKVFVVKSSDNGMTFAPPTVANAESLGVCACCSLKGLVVPNGDVVALYRAARAKAQRDMTLLISKDGGRTFQADMLHAWNTSTCPMSSAAMLPLSQGLRIAWETRGKIFSTIYGSGSVPAPVEISGENAKHPAMAANGRGETLIAWAVGTGWKRGGSVAWTIVDSAGKASDARGTNDELAVWSFPAAYAEANGDFVIVR